MQYEVIPTYFIQSTFVTKFIDAIQNETSAGTYETNTSESPLIALATIHMEQEVHIITRYNYS